MIIVPTNPASISPVTISGSPRLYPSYNDLTTNATLPTHSPGDLLLIVGSSLGSGAMGTTPPSATGTVPAWTVAVQYSGISGYVITLAYAIATTSSHTTGVWNGGGGCALALKGFKTSAPVGVNKFFSTAGYTGGYVGWPGYGDFAPANSSGSSLFFYVTSGYANQGTPLGTLPSTQTTVQDIQSYAYYRLSTLNSRTSAVWDGPGTISSNFYYNTIGFEIVGN